MTKILIIDDDVASCRMLELHLSSQQFGIEIAHNVDDGLQLAARTPPDLIILDIQMPGRSGLEGLPDFVRLHPKAPVIMITAFQDMDSTIEAMQKGACEYIHKPIDLNELDQAISTTRNRREATENDLEVEPNYLIGRGSMVGSCHQMKEVYKTIGLVASQPVSVLIEGESGTGKELVARAIHQASERANGPFVAINCAALVETLMESDMFGHEKGAFTGAVSRQPGKFELANGGTIFLDEVGELSQDIQAKLLRVLEQKEFIPVGGTKTCTTNARIIAATNVDLKDAVRENRFREDLYYRLQIVSIDLPPLREREGDMLPLVQNLLGRINRELKRNITRLSHRTMSAFMHYQWPGNVRELYNVLTKAAALCPGDIITHDLIPTQIVACANDENNNGISERLGLHENENGLVSLDEWEKQHVIRVLGATNWHKGQTCEILGVSRPRLRRMIEHHGIVETADKE